MDSSCLWRMCDPGCTEGTEGVVTPQLTSDLCPKDVTHTVYCRAKADLLLLGTVPPTLHCCSLSVYVCVCVLVCVCAPPASVTLKWKDKCHWIIMSEGREPEREKVRGREKVVRGTNETNEEWWARCGLACQGVDVCVYEWQSKKIRGATNFQRITHDSMKSCVLLPPLAELIMTPSSDVTVYWHTLEIHTFSIPVHRPRKRQWHNLQVFLVASRGRVVAKRHLTAC